MPGGRLTVRNIAVATMTKAQGAAEARRIVRALAVLAAKGLPLAVCDHGSPPPFRERLRRIPGLTIVDPESDGLVGQVQSAIAAAARMGRPFILYTEPDKHDFFDRALVAFVRRASRGADVVVAARSAGAFSTFPEIQRLAEAAANELCRGAIGIDTDYFYGPFLLRRELAAAIGRAPRSLGWGWRPFFFATAHRHGHRIAAVTGEYRCPREQRAEDRRARSHRIRQLTENVRGLAAAGAWPIDLRRRSPRVG